MLVVDVMTYVTQTKGGKQITSTLLETQRNPANQPSQILTVLKKCASGRMAINFHKHS